MGKNGDKLLEALSSIVDDSLDFTAQEYIFTATPSLSSKTTWLKPPTTYHQRWAQHAQEKMKDLSPEASQILNVILVILRNLSFVAANARCIAYSNSTLRILAACLYEDHNSDTGGEGDAVTSSSSSTACNLSLHALHTLVNISPYIDVTGQALLCDKLFLESSMLKTLLQQDDVMSLSQLGWSGLGLAKRFDVREGLDVPLEFRWQLTQCYLTHVHSIFSALRHVFTAPKSPRPVVMMAMELLKEFLEHTGGVVLPPPSSPEPDLPSMGWILRELPDDMLQRLADCLWIPRLGPDALDYVNPLHNIVSRVSTLKLLMGYDATVDTELRDRSLDVLVSWVALSTRLLAGRLALRGGVRLMDALLPALTTRVGRNEAPQLATTLVRYLGSAPEAERGLLYVQDRILEVASRDASVAHLVLTHLYVDPRDESSGSEQSGEEEEGSDGAEDDKEIGG